MLLHVIKKDFEDLSVNTNTSTTSTILEENLSNIYYLLFSFEIEDESKICNNDDENV